MWQPLRRFTGFCVGVIVLGNLYRSGSLRPSPEDALEPTPPRAVRSAAPFRFRENAANLGLHYEHRLYYPNPNAGSYLPLMALPPSIAVADIDGDGFYDIYVTQPDPQLPNKLFRNIDGHGFTEIGSQIGLTKPPGPHRRDPDSVALFVDLDRDGKLDLVQSRFGCHTVYLQDAQRLFFHEQPERFGGYCSNPKGVNFADLDRDGWLDLVFANYYPATPLATYLPLNHVFGYAGADYWGGTSEVIYGGPERFDVGKRVRLATAAPTHGHAQAVGISDIDRNGFPDIYVASDYSFDALYLGSSGRSLVDATEQWIPRREHGFSGMNVEFADFDNSGELGIFVSQMHIPPFVQTGNLLWKREVDRFRNVAAERGVKRCGWAWTGKFADFDNSGSLDLFVINGKARGRSATSRRDGYKSFAFVRNTISTLPLQLRWDINLYPPFDSFTMSGFQPSCLFWNRNGQFFDVARDVGIDDLEEGQAAALVDFDNDGSIDIVVANMGARLLFYRNVTPHPGNWVGVLPLWGHSNQELAYGARLTMHRSDGRTPVRELYPANGYRGQSDPRIHFGLGAATSVPQIEVLWPDGKREAFEQLTLNRYQPIRYGTGRAL